MGMGAGSEPDPDPGLERELAEAFVRTHPREAGRVLGSLATAEAAGLLAALPAADAARVLEEAATHQARDLLGALPAPVGAALVRALPLDRASAILRGLDESMREPVLEALPRDLSRSLASLLAFPPGTAGAVMDPQVLSLPADLSAAEATERVRAAPAHVVYNLYVLDPRHRVAGVLNLRELLLAPPDVTLDRVTREARHRLSALADTRTLVEHPGWREVHSLPVVDREGTFLGAVRYRTLRRLEDELRERVTEPGTPTAEALGDLIWTGVSGLLDAVVSPRR